MSAQPPATVRGARKAGSPVVAKSSPHARYPFIAVEGAVESVSPQGVTVSDRLGALHVGARLSVATETGPLVAEVVGIAEGSALCLPFGSLTGVRRGAMCSFDLAGAFVRPADAWLGRVMDGFARPLDGKGALPQGMMARALRATPPPAIQRARLGGPVDFGVRALAAFAPSLAGQRLGLFAASGVGKSVLLSMIARNTSCDVAVIALIGERGREVREFIEDHLGPEGLARAVIIVATSDEPAMMRREAAFLAATVAEHFRDRGDHVLCMMDSLTRVAAAQREIGLAAGEPPTAKGYTPSVFSLLPSILERAGPGLEGQGAVTGVFTVLVEGDDHDEPIADAARSILDGHVVLDRRIAERGRFPAIDILRSVSRCAGIALPEASRDCVLQARALASAYEDMRDMIRVGAYRHGASQDVDAAIAFHPHLERYLAQRADERSSLGEAYTALADIVAQQGGAPA